MLNARLPVVLCVVTFALGDVICCGGDEPRKEAASDSQFRLTTEQKRDLVDHWDGKMTSRIPEPVRSALQEATEIEIFSLDPKHLQPGYQDQYFRKKILGSTVIKDIGTRKLVLAAFDKAVRDVPDDGEAADCFDPHHALRVEHNGKSFYVLICFSCNQVMVCIDDAIERDKWFLVENWPHITFNEVLREEGLPLSESNTQVVESYYHVKSE